jgi:hypothetical protein
MVARADHTLPNEALVPFDNSSSDKHSLSLTTAPVVAQFLHGIEKGKFTARQVENVRNHKQFGPVLARLQVHFIRTYKGTSILLYILFDQLRSRCALSLFPHAHAGHLHCQAQAQDTSRRQRAAGRNLLLMHSSHSLP